MSPSTKSASDLDDGSANVAITQSGNIGDPYDINNNDNTKAKRAEDVARMVFSFVSGAGDFVDGMDGGDDLKLLRVRTRKNEIVIVPGESFFTFSYMFIVYNYILPGALLIYSQSNLLIRFADSKFLLVVIHDSPGA